METEKHPVFGLTMPKSCPGVDPAILNPRQVWRDKDAYDRAAEKLRDMFRANFETNEFGRFGIEAVM